MAIIYLGRNNKAKKINNLYVGINSQPKQVVKGYVGVNGYSKLFYKKEFYNYPQLAFIKNPGITRIDYSIGGESIVNISNSIDYIYYHNQSSSGKIRRSLILNKFYNRIYLNENSSNFFGTNLNIYYNSFDTLNEKSYSVNNNINVEIFLFNKVENLGKFCLGEGSPNGYSPNLVGNISNCNFINVINMSEAFYRTKIWGSPKIKNNTTNMYLAFVLCYYLNGKPSCGANVIDMYGAYESCENLIGSPVCGPNVINMAYAYYDCYKLTGDIAIGEKVINARSAYCWVGQYSTRLKLNNLYVGKYKAIDLGSCFSVANVYGDIYILNNKSNINSIFYSVNSGDKKINIHYPAKYSLVSLNSAISSIRIRTTSTGEIHTIVDGTYIDIKHNNGISTNVRIYNDYIES